MCSDVLFSEYGFVSMNNTETNQHIVPLEYSMFEQKEFTSLFQLHIVCSGLSFKELG